VPAAERLPPLKIAVVDATAKHVIHAVSSAAGKPEQYRETCRCEHVFVTLMGVDQGIELMVKDVGVGFEPALVSGKRNSVGIVGMKERLRLLGGTTKIDSRPGHGTTPIFTVPLSEVN